MSVISVESLFRGVTTPLPELYDRIAQYGWEVKGVKHKNGQFVAEGTSQNEPVSVERYGPDPGTAVGNLLMYITRKEHGRTLPQLKVGMWQKDWISQMSDIADAYSKAPVYDPKAAVAWKELADDSMARFKVLSDHLKIEVTNDPEPYKTLEEMCEEIHKKQKFKVSKANADHPIWSVAQTVAFRTVHDVLGHCVSGGDFGWHGENKACSAHLPLLSHTAQQALFTECIGSSAYAQQYRAFGPHKIAFLNDFMDSVQESENSSAHRGIHPSQSLAPSAMPEIKKSNVAAGERDPNHGYQTNVEVPIDNAYMYHGDPLEHQKVTENAALINTDWHKFGDRNMMKQAIVNAFRVVLLSPRKDLRWNAAHYQDISHIPADVTDPKVYWDALESKRKHWNTARGRHPEAHLIYFKPRKKFYQYVQAHNPEMGHNEAIELADEKIYHMREQEEKRILAEDEHKPENKRRAGDEIERRVNEAVAKRLELITKPTKPETDVPEVQEPPMSLFSAAGQYDIFTGESADFYGAWMGTHLKAIAQISHHSEELLDAAMEDVHEHDAKGYHFRAEVLKLNLSGVGPKVTSFAWLLLQPLTSQLATIDIHMMDVLGHNYDKDMNPRDYFKFERELQAGRDSSGYAHVPLGAFQWGMWDNKRTGQGSHQDHSAMKVLDPKPHQDVDWAAKVKGPRGEEGWAKAPDWWEKTQPARDQVAQEWDESLGSQYPRNVVPLQPVPPRTARLSTEAWTWEPGNNGKGVFDAYNVIWAWNVDEDGNPGHAERPEGIDLASNPWKTAFHIGPDGTAMFWKDQDDDEEYELLEQQPGIVSVLRSNRFNDDPGWNFSKVAYDDGSRTQTIEPWEPWKPGERGKGIVTSNGEVHMFNAGNGGDVYHDDYVTDLLGEGQVNWHPEGDDPLGMGKSYGDKVAGFFEVDKNGRIDECQPDTLDMKQKIVSADSRLGYQNWSFSKVADKEFSKGFAHWWNKEKPHTKANAGKMAEYAVGTKTSRAKAEEFLNSHKSDVKGDFEEFKKAFFKKFKRISKTADSAFSLEIPFFTHPHTGQKVTGKPGQTAMQHITESMALSTPEIWALDPDAGKEEQSGP